MKLRFIYEIATDRFFHLRLPAPCPRRLRRPARPPVPATWPHPGQTSPQRPLFHKPTLSWRHKSSPRAPTLPVLATATNMAGRAVTAVRASPSTLLPGKFAPSSTSPSSLAYKRPTRPSSRAETAPLRSVTPASRSSPWSSLLWPSTPRTNP